jgi:hypothetical protein
MLGSMKHRFISKTFGKRITIGGVLGFTVGLIVMFTALLPMYSVVGSCAAQSCNTNFDTRELVVRVSSLAVIASAAAIIGGVIIMSVAKARKEIAKIK